MGAANPMLFAEGVPNAAAAHLSLMFNLKGACQTIIGSRTAGLNALRLAFLRVRGGQWDRAVVGAAEEYSPLVNAAYGHRGLYAGRATAAFQGRGRGDGHRAHRGRTGAGVGLRLWGRRGDADFGKWDGDGAARRPAAGGSWRWSTKPLTPRRAPGWAGECSPNCKTPTESSPRLTARGSIRWKPPPSAVAAVNQTPALPPSVHCAAIWPKRSASLPWQASRRSS